MLLLLGLALHLSPLNLRWMRWVHALPGALPAEAWTGLTLMGFGWAVAIVMLALDRREGLLTALLARAVPLSILLTQLPKHLFFSPRPLRVLNAAELVPLGEPVLQSSSMPSGHALAAFTGVGLLCLARASRHSRPGRWCLLVVVLGAGVAWSRVVVAAHWPADVFAGAGLGLLTAALAATMEARQPWQPRLAQASAQRKLALCELGIALGWGLTVTGFESVRLLQWALVALALCSACLRWRAASAGLGAAASAIEPGACA